MSVGQIPGFTLPTPAGNTNKFLSSDGKSFVWQEPSAGVNEGMELIASVTYSPSGSAITNIPQTYKHLQLVIENPRFVSISYPGFRFNGDFGLRYQAYSRYMNTSGTVTDSTANPNSTGYYPMGVSGFTSAEGIMVCNIYNYTSQASAYVIDHRWYEPNSQFVGFGVGVYRPESSIAYWKPIRSISFLTAAATAISGKISLYGVN